LQRGANTNARMRGWQAFCEVLAKKLVEHPPTAR
jgi:hypothetical protein